MPDQGECVQVAAKETEKAAAFFRTYSDPSSDYIGPEGRTTAQESAASGAAAPLLCLSLCLGLRRR